MSSVKSKDNRKEEEEGGAERREEEKKRVILGGQERAPNEVAFKLRNGHKMQEMPCASCPDGFLWDFHWQHHITLQMKAGWGGGRVPKILECVFKSQL